MPAQIPSPAYLVRTPRLVLRCWNPADAPLLVRAISANLEHLRPWMPWAQTAPDLESEVQVVRRMRGEFDLDQDYVYGILSPDESCVLGGTGLHKRIGPDAFEIGYWIDHAHTRQGLALEAAGAMARVAFDTMAAERVEIHCDPRNAASAGVARKLRFIHARTDETATEEGSARLTMIWTLKREGLAQSLASDIALQAFDALGRQIL